MGVIIISSITRTALIGVAVSLYALSTFTGSAAAHAFGLRYDLPMALAFYLTGAGAAVALSFVIMALFIRRHQTDIAPNPIDLLQFPPIGWLGHRLSLGVTRLLSVAIFWLVLSAAIFGIDDPFDNLAPTFVWVVWWVGMAFVSALIGNLWELVNPWKIIAGWVTRIRPPRAYPSALAQWPAVLMFFAFAWMELIGERTEQPAILAMLIITYSLITWSGMAIYGSRTWLDKADAFSIVFGILSKFAPTCGTAGHWNLRAPAVGLLARQPADVSSIAFVVLLLTTVTFDGILETPLWADILEWVAENQFLRPLLVFLQDAGVDLIGLLKTSALIVLPFIFFAVYLAFCGLVALAGGGRIPVIEVAGYFILSLVPIAAAYHLSHYLSYLLIAGQNIIPLASDPFGVGWNLFGTAGYQIDLGIVTAKMVWIVAVCAIVTGHVFAVYVAHVMALRVFPDRRAALRSQIPMLVLMVGYTMISLWILSQPVVS